MNLTDIQNLKDDPSLILGAWLLVIVIGVVVGIIVGYVLYAVGLYKMAVRKNLERPWLAFIPLLNQYTLGEIIGPFQIVNLNINQPGWTVLLVQVVSLFMGGILAFVALALSLYLNYLLYKMYMPSKTVLLFTLSIVSLGLLVPIFIFAIRNQDPYQEENLSSGYDTHY